MKILSLDVATTTGVAVGDSGGAPKCWSVDLGKGRSHEARFSEILRLTHGVIEKHKPELVVVETPIGGQDANALLIGLAACARGVAANQAVPSVSVYPSTVRKHFMGKAKTSRHFPGMTQAKAKLAIKEEIQRRCLMMGWDVPDLDSADAAAGWDWAQATYARGYQAKPVGELFG